MIGMMFCLVEKSKEWQWLDYSIIDLCLQFWMNVPVQLVWKLRQSSTTKPKNLKSPWWQCLIVILSSNSMTTSSDLMERVIMKWLKSNYEYLICICENISSLLQSLKINTDFFQSRIFEEQKLDKFHSKQSPSIQSKLKKQFFRFYLSWKLLVFLLILVLCFGFLLFLC